MPFLLGRSVLVCFYCGSKSNYVQDGSVREWKCLKCDAVNHLDEKGEITDPPVAELHESSSSIKYAQTLPRYDSAAPAKSENLFCDACLKNQHLFTASLAQYIPDDSNPLIDRKYIKFRENLEKRYPQVCEDCAPRVVERYNRSQYEAKADHMRRLMDKTRENSGPRRSGVSWIDTFGWILYWLGIWGQICWNLATIYKSGRARLLDTCASDEIVLEEQSFGIQHEFTALVSLICWIASLGHFPLVIIRNSTLALDSDGYMISALAKWGFWSSAISLWWNPKLRQVTSGFDSHIKGLSDWYKYQVMLLTARIIFRSIVGHRTLGNPDAPATLGAHTFMLGFTIFITVLAPKTIKTDIRRLFTPLTPEKLRPYVGPSKTAIYKGDDLAQALDDVFDSPGASQSSTGYNNRVFGRYQAADAVISNGSPRSRNTVDSVSNSIYSAIAFSSETDEAMDAEEMDWDPVPSQHLNFHLAQSPRISQLFGQPLAPAPSKLSPFRGKLPPAPISMAHKLRNPPNPTRLQPPSQKAKENFFNRMNGREIAAGKEACLETSKKASRHREIEFAPPRFFPAQTDDSAGLTEAFESSFRLDSGDKRDIRRPSETNAINWKHVYRALVLLLAFFIWIYALTNPSEYLTYRPPISMLVCGLIALLSAYDYTVSPWAKKLPKPVVFVGGVLATVQTLAAAYTFNEIRARRAHYKTYQPQGTLLIVAMLVQEAYFAAFKRT